MRAIQFLFLAGPLLAAGLLLAQTGGQQSTGKPAGNSEPRRTVEKGRELYKTYCEVCHYATSTEKKIGPGLKALYRRGKFANGRKVDDTGLRTWVLEGGVDMPAFAEALTGAQVAELIAYLKTL